MTTERNLRMGYGSYAARLAEDEDSGGE